MLDCDEYLVPGSLDEAFDLIDAHPGRHRIVAGATDLLPWARQGRAGDVHVPALIDISRIPELRGHTLDDGRLRIGAATTFQGFLTDPILRAHAPVMPHVAVWFADDQIREQATLGGNIVNASPAADGTAAMLAMGASVTLERRAGGSRRRRDIALGEFVTGPAATRLEPGEILTAVECDSLAGYGAAFEKVGHRRSLVISIVCVAALVRVDGARSRFEDVRLAIAGIGPVPARLAECEEVLIGRKIEAGLINTAAALPTDRVRSRTRQAYRREVVTNFIRRALHDALADCGVRMDETDPSPDEVRYG